MVLALTRRDIMETVSMADAIEAVKKAFAESTQGSAQIPLRTQIDVEATQGVLLYMPGFLAESGALGIKVVSVYPNNPTKGKDTIQSMILLQNRETGETEALMEGGYLTALRTGAASGAATAVLANKNASCVAVFGAGKQARTQLEGVAAVRRITDVKVYDPNPAAVMTFIDFMSRKFDSIRFYAGRTPTDILDGADVIITATVSKTPVFCGNDLKPGVHINGVGSYKPSMRELDEVTISRADKVVVDNRLGSLEEAGDLIEAIRLGCFTPQQIHAEMGEIILGSKPGRENENEITIFKTVGFAALDMAVARLAYLRSMESGRGYELDLMGVNQG